MLKKRDRSTSFILSFIKGVLLFTLCANQVGCPGTGKPTQSICTQVGQQCKRRQGELGVCTPTSPHSSHPHSLECVAQH